MDMLDDDPSKPWKKLMALIAKSFTTLSFRNSIHD
jgi:hypothetical protein